VIGYLCCVLGYGFGEAVEFVARRKADISTLPNLIKTIEEAKTLSNPSLRALPSKTGIDAKNMASARKL
jgi:hypothetical protein